MHLFEVPGILTLLLTDESEDGVKLCWAIGVDNGWIGVVESDRYPGGTAVKKNHVDTEISRNSMLQRGVR